MKVSDFTYLLQHPQKLDTPLQTRQLEEVLDAYPWFQAARALHLKGLRNLNSYKYNQALKATAAGTADREVLFDFITSEEFLQNSIADAIAGKSPIQDREIVSEEVAPEPGHESNLVGSDDDGPLPRSTEDAERILDPGLFQSADPEVDRRMEAARNKLEIGRPLQFNRGERYSFSEWLQLTSFKKSPDSAKPAETPTTRVPDSAESAGEKNDSIGGDNDDRDQKFARIDRFIAANPKMIPRTPSEADKVDIRDSLKLDKKEVMTETLARVYLEQGKFKKAIQAYRILSLKYPEKSGYFADRIKAVEKLRNSKI